MKKYFLGLIAVILIAGASAFVKSKTNAPLAVYHWYYVNASGVVVSGSDAFSGTPETQAFANANPPCPTGNTSDCIRGFVNVPPFPTMAIGDATPLKKP
jgi:hypothetical protein